MFFPVNSLFFGTVAPQSGSAKSSKSIVGMFKGLGARQQICILGTEPDGYEKERRKREENDYDFVKSFIPPDTILSPKAQRTHIHEAGTPSTPALSPALSSALSPAPSLLPSLASSEPPELPMPVVATP